MKKLNRKGFTLIELLAVIVILAIILVVTVPNIINYINDARVSSLHNLSVSAAGTYDKVFAQDLLAAEANKALGDIPSRVGSTWLCLNDSKLTSTTGLKRNLVDVIGISTTDVKIDGTALTGDVSDTAVTASTCSSIRIVNGNAEVLLIASNSGKFAVAGKTVYAYSKAANGVQK